MEGFYIAITLSVFIALTVTLSTLGVVGVMVFHSWLREKLDLWRD